ncbi:uncharacterized protein DNG_09047 [Cephalotrichum gorgonifer]|uniref:Uncharacterized protein n=1 Tax=Cephalotrichum gorgonifer TaxID=2041049 RepID=A0AAE8SZ27_9PEZI|nr:uncharacterized protein DNG_09047 [Cephalotrichum gorgonifer]
MHVSHLIVLAAVAVAQAPLPKDYPGAEECTSVVSSLQSVITGFPEPDRFVSNMAYGYHFNRFTNSDDPCALPKVTGVSAEPFSEWAVSYTKWREGVIPEYQEIWEACSRDPQIFNLLPVGPDRCSSLAAQITGGAGGDDGDDDDDGGDSDDGDDSESGSGEEGGESEGGSGEDDGSGASRETQSIAAAAALAGVVMAALLH